MILCNRAVVIAMHTHRGRESPQSNEDTNQEEDRHCGDTAQCKKGINQTTWGIVSDTPPNSIQRKVFECASDIIEEAENLTY